MMVIAWKASGSWSLWDDHQVDVIQIYGGTSDDSAGTPVEVDPQEILQEPPVPDLAIVDDAETEARFWIIICWLIRISISIF